MDKDKDWPPWMQDKPLTRGIRNTEPASRFKPKKGGWVMPYILLQTGTYYELTNNELWAFYLVGYGRMPFQEIADFMGCAKSTAREYVGKAWKKLGRVPPTRKWGRHLQKWHGSEDYGGGRRPNPGRNI